MSALTIGVPCYNEERHIAQCLGSLIGQTGDTDFRVVISDNASTDGTSEVIAKTLSGAPAAFADRVTLIRQPENTGVHRNFWAAYEASETPYFMWLGAHDAVTPDFVDATLPLIAGNPEVAMATGQPYGIRDGQANAFQVPDAVYDFSAEDAYVRYHQSVQKLANCTVFHSIFRHADLEDMRRIEAGPWDHVLISRLLGKGRLAYSTAGYLRRYFPEAPRDPAKPIYAKDMTFVTHYLEDFEKVFEGRIPSTLRANFAQLLFLELVNRFGLPPVARQVA